MRNRQTNKQKDKQASIKAKAQRKREKQTKKETQTTGTINRGTHAEHPVSISWAISFARSGRKDTPVIKASIANVEVWCSATWDRLVGLVVKASAPRAEDTGFESRLRRDFSGAESYQ